MPGKRHWDAILLFLFSGYAGYRSSPHGPHPTDTSVMVVPTSSPNSSAKDRMKSR